MHCSSMDINEYQQMARRTAIYPNAGQNMTYPTLGLDLSNVAQGNLDKLADRAKRGTIKGNGDNR